MKSTSEIASDHLRSKTIMPTRLSSAQLDLLDVNVRRKSFFSSRVYHASVLSKAQQLTSDIADGKLDRASARALLKSELARIDYAPVPGQEGTIKDLRSDRRLNLILDTNVDMARGYGAWMAGQSEGAMLLYPGQELIRVGPMPAAPREWRQRWLTAGGKFHKGRMIAHKTDPIWRRISRFGNPYPPFDYQSGMRLKGVRDEEDALTPHQDPNHEAELVFGGAAIAGAAGLSPQFRAVMQSYFGDLIQFDDAGKVISDGFTALEEMHQNVVARLADPELKQKRIKAISLGTPGASLIRSALDAGVDYMGYRLILAEDDLYHILRNHRVESRGDQRDLTLDDLLVFAMLWRNPRLVGKGNKDGSLGLQIDYRGLLIAFTMIRNLKDKTLRLSTLYAKK